MNELRDIGKIALALSKAQGAFEPVQKTRPAKVQMKSGGTYTYMFADLSDVFAAIKAALKEQELCVCQGIVVTPEGEQLETLLIHSSGQYLRNLVPLSVAQGTGPQALGSALTYARRYGLTALIGIAAEEDDDAQSAEAARKENPQTKSQKAKPPEEPHSVNHAELTELDKYALPMGGYKGIKLYERPLAFWRNYLPKLQDALNTGQVPAGDVAGAKEAVEALEFFLGPRK